MRALELDSGFWKSLRILLSSPSSSSSFPVGLRDLGWLELEPQILVGRPRSRRQRLLSQEPARPDLAEPVGRIGHRFPARGDFQ